MARKLSARRIRELKRIINNSPSLVVYPDYSEDDRPYDFVGYMDTDKEDKRSYVERSSALFDFLNTFTDKKLLLRMLDLIYDSM